MKIRSSVNFLSVLFVFVFITAVSVKAGGEVDPTFNPAVQKIGGSGRAIAIQSDGKILVGGNFTIANRIERSAIARFNSDGSLDSSFNPNSDIIGTYYGSFINAIKIQSDGKILIGGNFTSVGGALHKSIARLNADGTVDNTFVTETSVTRGLFGTVNDIEIRPDGKILAAGNFTYEDNTGSTRFRNVALFNSDGSRDTLFYYDGPENVLDLALLPDNRILVGGSVFLQRRSANGTAEFNYSVNGAVNTIALLPDGQILIGGGFTQYNGFAQGKIAKIALDGSLNVSFNSNGAGFNNAVNRIVLAPDGKIVVGGSFNNFNGNTHLHIVRLNSNGLLDTTFNYTPAEIIAPPLDVKVQADGKIVLSDFNSLPTGTNRRDVKRLNVDGTLDASFGVSISSYGTVYDILPLPDGKILIGGAFDAINDVRRINLARLNANGTLDASFTGALIGCCESITPVYSIAVLPTGKILVGVNNNLIILNSDGTGGARVSGNFGFVKAIVVQSDGKILVGGSNGIFRLNANNSIDTSFNVTVNGQVEDILLSMDGKILISGSFTQVNGANRGRIARIGADGSLDNSFNPPGGANNTVETIALQSDGKVVIGGMFTAVNGANRFYLARLNADGSLDEGYVSNANYFVHSVLVQPDGKILAGGEFTILNDVSRSRYARLNSDGSLDASFNVGSGANIYVNDIALQADGNILLGGSFTRVNNNSRIGIARLLNSTTARRTQFDFDGDGRADFAVFRPTGANWYIFNSSNNSITASQFGVSSDLIAPADYDGDGRTDIAVFRPTGTGDPNKAYFYIQQSRTNTFRPEQFGRQGDIPVSGDWDGDGTADLAVYRDGSQTGGQSYFFYRPSSQPGVDFRAIAWGATGDKPVVGDYDGDGKLDAAVFRPSIAYWYISRSSDNVFEQRQFGVSTDIPVPADFDGDGRTNFAVYRSSTSTWYTSTNPATNYGETRWGVPTDVPVPADYDGDGRADIAVFRPENGTWYVLRSSSGLLGIQWGTTNDKPAPAAYVP
ncbi:MAG: FG-GAP-like repeat-containing protein [Acidobacteriota bacterium]|nr:FG-GAP-like repeat-containing protein [Acidobacteriota bacterium]